MDWLTPTRRAVRWSPMVVAGALAAATLVIMRIADRPLRADVLLVAMAMLVLGALSGLHDPGRDFVHAMPVTAARRLTHRLVVLVPAAAVGLLLTRWMAAALFRDLPDAPSSAALAAYGATGVAACAVLTRRVGPRATEVALSVMLIWLVGGLWLVQIDVPLGVAMPWWRWPLAVASGAGAVTVLATTRGVEA